jgi:hypothetical protein
MNLPTYRGESDYSPFEFLNKFERYAQSEQIPLSEALVSIMPCALEGKAATWWKFCKQNQTWADFKEDFLKMFGPPDYDRQHGHELERRIQGPKESLTTSITTINEYYEKLESNESDAEKVKRVLRQMHQSYKPYMWHRKFANLYEMMQYAHEVQSNLYFDKAYQPPPTFAESFDPSLAYRGPRSDGNLTRPHSKERRDYSRERA